MGNKSEISVQWRKWKQVSVDLNEASGQDCLSSLLSRDCLVPRNVPTGDTRDLWAVGLAKHVSRSLQGFIHQKKKKQKMKYAEPAERWQSVEIKLQNYVKGINAKTKKKACSLELIITSLNKIKN